MGRLCPETVANTENIDNTNPKFAYLIVVFFGQNNLSPGSYAPHRWFHVVDQAIDFGLLKIVQVLRRRLVLQEVDAGKRKPIFE